MLTCGRTCSDAYMILHVFRHVDRCRVTPTSAQFCRRHCTYVHKSCHMHVCPSDGVCKTSTNSHYHVGITAHLFTRQITHCTSVHMSSNTHHPKGVTAHLTTCQVTRIPLQVSLHIVHLSSNRHNNVCVTAYMFTCQGTRMTMKASLHTCHRQDIPTIAMARPPGSRFTIPSNERTSCALRILVHNILQRLPSTCYTSWTLTHNTFKGSTFREFRTSTNYTFKRQCLITIVNLETTTFSGSTSHLFTWDVNPDAGHQQHIMTLHEILQCICKISTTYCDFACGLAMQRHQQHIATVHEILPCGCETSTTYCDYV